ncbi:MAG: hypothetical protein WCL01_05740 [Comamonadaceae bacterium]
MKTNAADTKPEQLEIFDINPAIRNLGILDIHLSGGMLKGSFAAATEANDIALLTPERWAAAFAEYLIKTCKGDPDKAHRVIDDAFEELKNIQILAVEIKKTMDNTNVTKLHNRKIKE